MTKRDNIVKWSIVSIFVALYAMVSIISTIHVIDFFRLSNPEWLAITLAISFEIGAAACLGAIVILDRTSRWLVWALFILITGMQMMGNMYYAYSHLQDFQNWIELFGLQEEEIIYQKRILSIVSGAILPIVALGFIKSLVDYIRPNKEGEDESRDLSFTSYIDEVDEIIEDSIEDIEGTIDDIQADDTLTVEEKSKKIEKKVKQAILNNPEIKDKIEEAIKNLEDEDKYTKIEENPIADINNARRTFGAM